ncbi:hypothetical protein [Planctobacterium marinum]|uniref:Uncharacterized protein n=1 Tax=Planctobacterium marinum TaxID=1631968 RepID=A0AA48KNT6_9ALTE|nr:hypothetical protein MACH26_02340 [Planctobacterium marinum]
MNKNLTDWVLLLIAIFALMGAVFVAGVIAGQAFITGEVELSPLYFGILGGGFAAVFVLMRSVKKLQIRFNQQP